MKFRVKRNPEVGASPPEGAVVATLVACEQYRFRVNFPANINARDRHAIRTRALEETNRIFLDCTRQYQAIGWVGDSNVSFTDSRSSPNDSLSEFLHLLFSLKIVELAVLHAQRVASENLVVIQETPLRWAARDGFQTLCAELGVSLIQRTGRTAASLYKPRIGGTFRSAAKGGKPFTHEPLKRLDDLRAALGRRLSTRPLGGKVADYFLKGIMLVLWPLPVAARVLFTIWYRWKAKRVCRRLDGNTNTFLYFDLRLGRNRDVAAYCRWKFAGALSAISPPPILFSHIPRTCNAYGLKAMRWSARSLALMEKDPTDGCVVANYLIPPGELLLVQFRRHSARRRVRRKLREMHAESADLLTRLIYQEFIANLDHTNAFALEIAAGYNRFFGSLRPGVVLQADAVAKTARHFTTVAKRKGSRMIYLADRICTRLRTSNQLIADGGDHPHFPDWCVCFDAVTRDEFLRQGISADNIVFYRREFAVPDAHREAGTGRPNQVLILLQAYEDNIGAMLGLGPELVTRLPEVEVIYQEHPNFPVGSQAKARLLENSPARLRFLAPGEAVNYRQCLAQVTGYSTAAVPGVLAGVPLVWLRGQVENSIFCEDLFTRIGFPADTDDAVVNLLTRLAEGDPEMLEAATQARFEAAKIFNPAGTGEMTLAAAIGRALEACRLEVANAFSALSR